MKKIALGILVGLSISVIVGCSTESEARYNRDWKEYQVVSHVYELVDPDTGVHYLANYANGGLTVMYNEDGTVKTD